MICVFFFGGEQSNKHTYGQIYIYII